MSNFAIKLASTLPIEFFSVRNVHPPKWVPSTSRPNLDCGFKHLNVFIFIPIPGKMIQFDDCTYFNKWVLNNHQLENDLTQIFWMHTPPQTRPNVDPKRG